MPDPVVPYIYKARVDKVVDGDTLQITLDLGLRLSTVQRVRLLGVNTPEVHAPEPEAREAALRAKAFTAAELEGKDVLVRTEKDDAFGRWLAVVYVDGQEWNTKLLDHGLAVPYERKRPAKA